MRSGRSGWSKRTDAPPIPFQERVCMSLSQGVNPSAPHFCTSTVARVSKQQLPCPAEGSVGRPGSSNNWGEERGSSHVSAFEDVSLEEELNDDYSDTPSTFLRDIIPPMETVCVLVGN